MYHTLYCGKINTMEKPIIFDIEDGEVGLHEDEKKEKESRSAAAAKDTKPHFYG